jgi:F-type H+-transporting ATPase subunit a
MSSAAAVEEAAHGALDASEVFKEMLFEHSLDSNQWHLPFGAVTLPDFLTVHGLMVVLCGVLLLVLFGVLYRKEQVVPRGITNMLEVFVIFVRDEIAIANLGEKDGRAFTPFFCSMFFFILGLNLLGIIPVFATATSNVLVTGAMASITLLTIIGMGVVRHGPIGYLKSFAPHGVPWPILVILYPIEVMGVFIKSFALTLRLFANMLGGHVVISSILGMTILFGWWVGLVASPLASCIYLMEIFVAFLQTYIFVLLSAMFVGAALHPEH